MKRRKIDKNDKKNQEKHPGGPLQRTGVSADSWNEALGSSIETIPFGYLPTHRTILRRYRSLRMKNEHALTNDLIAILVNEILYRWNSARILTCAKNRCHDQLRILIDDERV